MGANGLTDTDPIIEALAFGKSFAGRTVLEDVDLVVDRGEIHALVGQNGSGKSTFIKILSGYHTPDPGARLRVCGDAVGLPIRPGSTVRLGLSFVHQDLGLFEDGSVLENLMVGQYETRSGWRIDWAHERRRAKSILEAFALDLDPDTPLRRLAEVERAIIAIARAMQQLSDRSEPSLLVLDEPTARLPRNSVDTFFAAVRRVAEHGDAVLFVSHRLDEVVTIADRVTVLRDGHVVDRLGPGDLSVPQVVDAILGFSLEQLYPAPAQAAGDVVMRCEGIAGAGIERFDAEVRHGEIIGLTGLLGMGHEVIPKLLFGAVKGAAGRLTAGGTTLELARATPRRAMEMGIALLPGNRPREGALGDATARENLTLATLRRYFRTGVLRARPERRDVATWFERLGVSPSLPEAAMATFSGGNQQKLLLAKWFATEPVVLLLDEPTHGVDIGAKREILKSIRDMADRGTAVIVSSVEAEDLAQICHRVMVFRHGRVAGELAGAELTAARIIEQTQLDEPRHAGHSIPMA